MTTTSRRRATINDVARAAGVSRQTVSNAVNAPQKVRPETRARVLAEVDRLEYRPSSAARGMRSQRAGAIGLELSPAGGGSDIASHVLTALTAQAPGFDVHLVPFTHAQQFPSLDGYEDMFRRHLVDAFLFADTHSGDPRPAWLQRAGVPYAAFGRIYGHPGLTRWVDVDGRAGLEMAVEHLAAQGYTTVGYLGWPLHLTDPEVAEDRHRGWAEAAARLGLAGPAAVAQQDLRSATQAADDMLDELGPGDAIACASDLLALGVLYAACARGLRPGRDLGVVGFDGSLLALRHDLTTVAQPYDALAHHLLRLVHDQLVGGAPAPSGQLLTPTLTAGSTTDRSGSAPAPIPHPTPRR